MTALRRSIFAGTELAARIERAESEFMAQCVTPVPNDPLTAGNFSIAFGGGFATFGGADSPFTKVSGVGFAELPTRDEIAYVERRVTAAGGHVQVEISQLAEPELAEELTRLGYRLVSFENVLGRRLRAEEAAQPALSDRLEVQRAEDRMDDWMDVVVRGSLAPDTVGVPQYETFSAAELVRAEEAGVRAGSRTYLALLDGLPAGGGGLRMANGIAQLTGAAVAPEYRRQGVQSALLSVRLWDAAREGCDLAVVTTQPGSVSQANMQKFGFNLLYTRAVLVALATADA